MIEIFKLAVAHKVILAFLFLNFCFTTLVPQTLPLQQSNHISNPFSYKLINYLHSYWADVNTKQFNDTKNHICIACQLTDKITFTVSQFIFAKLFRNRIKWIKTPTATSQQLLQFSYVIMLVIHLKC